jgi:hypothetical protein
MRKGGVALLVVPAPAMAAAAPAPGEALAAGLEAPKLAVSVAPPVGFYRDERDRVMQVSFDLQQRLWLGVAYSPRQRSNGRQEVAPAAFDFGLTQEWYSDDGRTRHRTAVMDGEARINPFGLDVTAFHYDMSHAYGFPLLRLTTLWKEPARHDLFLNVGFYGDAGRMQIEPLGEAGNHQLTLASAQATLDLWQSWDLRSYVRLRVGPVAHMRLGPWHQEARLFTSLPETALEGNFILGKRALQQARFRVRGEWLRKLAWLPSPLARDWLVDGEASYEIILVAINDQPVSLRFAGRVGTRDAGPPVVVSVSPPPDAHAAAGGLEWSATGGLRISFFSPPVARSPRR